MNTKKLCLIAFFATFDFSRVEAQESEESQIKCSKATCVRLLAELGFDDTPIVPLVVKTSVEHYRETEAKFHPTTLTILHQSNRYGRMLPSQCAIIPYGGLAREANAVKQIRVENNEILLVDAGNAFGEPGGAVDIERSRALVAMLNNVGLEVLAPGPGDLALSFDFLKELERTANFEFVVSNLYHNGEPAFQRYYLTHRAGIKIAVVGLTNATSSDEFDVREPEEALRGVLSELTRKKAEFIVLLSQLPTSINESLAKSFPQVSLIVGSNPLLATERAFWIAPGRTLLVDSSNTGINLGRLDLDLKSPMQGRMFTSNEEVLMNLQRLQVLKEQAKSSSYINRFRQAKLLKAIVGGIEYRHTLIMLDEQRFGTPNAVTRMIAEHLKEPLH